MRCLLGSGFSRLPILRCQSRTLASLNGCCHTPACGACSLRSLFCLVFVTRRGRTARLVCKDFPKPKLCGIQRAAAVLHGSRRCLVNRCRRVEEQPSRRRQTMTKTFVDFQGEFRRGIEPKSERKLAERVRRVFGGRHLSGPARGGRVAFLGVWGSRLDGPTQPAHDLWCTRPIRSLRGVPNGQRGWSGFWCRRIRSYRPVAPTQRRQLPTAGLSRNATVDGVQQGETSGKKEKKRSHLN